MSKHLRARLLELFSSGLIALVLPGVAATQSTKPLDNQTTNPIVASEFVFEQAPFPSCHASTVAETQTGLVAAWFGGTRERNPDVGVWVARRNKNAWSKPVEVANGIQPGGVRHPCWNPVLFQVERDRCCSSTKWGRVRVSGGEC
jgi:BNR repeat protein